MSLRCAWYVFVDSVKLRGQVVSEAINSEPACTWVLIGIWYIPKENKPLSYHWVKHPTEDDFYYVLGKEKNFLPGVGSTGFLFPTKRDAERHAKAIGGYTEYL